MKHGHTAGPRGNSQVTRTYRSWQGMKQRCLNPNEPAFARYGAVGIDLDPRWHEFAAFLADMGERPAGKTLDRIDGKKGYFKENCRWATQPEQYANRDISKFAERMHKSHCPRGHALLPDNFYTPPSGGRRCKTCNREQQQRLRDARKHAV